MNPQTLLFGQLAAIHHRELLDEARDRRISNLRRAPAPKRIRPRSTKRQASTAPALAQNQL